MTQKNLLKTLSKAGEKKAYAQGNIRLMQEMAKNDLAGERNAKAFQSFIGDIMESNPYSNDFVERTYPAVTETVKIDPIQAPTAVETKPTIEAPTTEAPKAPEKPKTSTKKLKFDVMKKGGYQAGGEEEQIIRQKMASGEKLTEDEKSIATAISLKNNTSFLEEVNKYAENYQELNKKAKEVQQREYANSIGKEDENLNLLQKAMGTFYKGGTDVSNVNLNNAEAIEESHDTIVAKDKLRTDSLDKAWRLNNAGISNDEALSAIDPRNGLEKLLNLNPNNGLIGDGIDLLNRVGQVVPAILEGASEVDYANRTGDMSRYGGLSAREINDLTPFEQEQYLASLEEQYGDTNIGKNILTSIGNSLMGKDEANTGSALQNWTQNEQYFQDRATGARGGDWTDAVGLVGDLALDWTNYAMIPGTSTTKALDKTTDAVKTVDNVMDTAKATKELSKADVFQTIDKVLDATKNKNVAKFEKVDEARRLLEMAKQSGNKTDMTKALTNVQDALKAQQTLLSDAVTKGGRKAKFATVGDKMAELTKQIPETEFVKGLTGKLKESKLGSFADDFTKNLSKKFNSKNYKVNQEVIMNTSKRNAIATKVKDIAQPLHDDMVAMFNTGAFPEFNTVDELDKALRASREIRAGVEEAPEVADILATLKSGKNYVAPNTEEARRALDEWQSVANISSKELNGSIYDIKTSKDGKEFLVVNKGLANIDGLDVGKDGLPILDMRLEMGSGLSPDDYLRQVNLEQNPAFKELADRYDDVFRQSQEIAGQELFGKPDAFTGLSEGYVPHTTSPQARELMKLADKNNDAELGEAVFSGFDGEGGYMQSIGGRLRDRKTNFPTDVKNEIKKFELEQFTNSSKFAEVFPDFEKQQAFKELMDSPFFNETATSSLLDFVNEKVNPLARTQGTKRAIEATMKLGSDASTDFGLKVIGSTDVVGDGFKALTNEDAKKLLKDFEQLKTLGEETDSMLIKSFMKNLQDASKGKKKLAMTDDFYKLVLTGTQKGEVGRLVKGFDWVTAQFKGWAISTPGYPLRNEFQNIQNQILAGVDPKSALSTRTFFEKNRKAIFDGVDGQDSLIDLVRAGRSAEIADPKLRSMAESATEMMDKGVLGTVQFETARKGGDIRDLTQNQLAGEAVPVDLFNKTKKEHSVLTHVKNTPITTYKDALYRANQNADDAYKITTHFLVKENPSLMTKMGIDDPTDFVRLVHFDGTNLSTFESEKVKRAIPFYTINKQNKMYQIKNALTNPTTLKNMEKIREGMWDINNVDESQLTDYEQSGKQWASPIATLMNLAGANTTAGGEYSRFNGNASYSDGLTMSPLSLVEEAGESLNPIVTKAWDVLKNNDSFYNTKIRDDADSFDKKVLDSIGYYGKNALGLSGVLGIGDRASDVVQGMKEGDMPSGMDLLNVLGISRQGNIHKNAKNEAYETNDALQDLISSLKKKGTPVPDLNELKKQNIRLPHQSDKDRINALVKQLEALSK